MQSIQLFYPFLATPTSVVITTHQKPDGDAMGSSLGLYHLLVKLGHAVTVISPTNWAQFLDWMPGTDAVLDFDARRSQALAALETAQFVFCLDFNTLSRTRHLAPYLAACKAQKILIDHHEEPETSAFDYGISLPFKSSTAEMVFDFIVQAGYEDMIDDTIAQCIYTGVMTDTGSFRF
ncbi:MAG: bifunctional oligoribonuclease/PAP phosphatase NrnA, partial [Bacteroidetes bacterium]